MVYATALPDMSLLTPTESNAFQSFLSSVDVDSYSDSFMTSEWNVYGEVSETPGKETLTKATKDLMSLDASKWGNPLRSDGIQNPITSLPIQHQFSYKGQPSQHQQSSNESTRPQSPSVAIAPHRTVSALSPPHADDVPSTSSSPASIPMSASPPTPYEYYPHSFATSKRPSRGDKYNSSNKRSRPSHASSSSNSVPAPKPALLSPSQKKANHIQSEQKRRANIRKGYEALCDTIPALRSAIRLEEAACESGTGIQLSGNSNGKKKSRRKNMNEDGEKIDGRAGPRSENVVLQKSSYLWRVILEVHLLTLWSHSNRPHPRSSPGPTRSPYSAQYLAKFSPPRTSYAVVGWQSTAMGARMERRRKWNRWRRRRRRRRVAVPSNSFAWLQNISTFLVFNFRRLLITLAIICFLLIFTTSNIQCDLQKFRVSELYLSLISPLIAAISALWSWGAIESDRSPPKSVFSLQFLIPHS